VEAPKPASTANLKMTGSGAGKESYTSTSAASGTLIQDAAIAMVPVQPEPVVEEEDDPSVPVTAGTVCRRKGCGLKFDSDEANRIGDGEGTVCTYHPAPVSYFISKSIHIFQ
jgi:hypothetical protein